MRNELDHPAQPRDEDGPPVDGQTRNLAAVPGSVDHDPAAEIQRLREQLLGGRGPGATERERTVFMHNRPTLGALPTMIEREGLTLNEAVAWCGPDLTPREAARLRRLSETDDGSECGSESQHQGGPRGAATRSE